MRKLLLSFVMCVLGLLLLAPPALHAEPRIKFGNLAIIPGLAGQSVLDDNIYMANGTNDTNEKKVSDWINHIKPSLLLNYKFPERGYLNLGYQGDWAFYNTNSSNNWANNQGKLDFSYNAPVGLILGLTDTYINAEDPYGSADQYAVGRVTKRWTNELTSKVGWEFGKTFRTMLFYNNYKQQYKNDQDFAQNYDDQEVGVGLAAKFLPKTWGFLRYHYGKRDYNTYAGVQTENNDSDFTWNKVTGGLTWDPAAKLQGELNFGYQWKAYKNQLTAGGLARENKNTWIAATSINFKPMETTSLGLNISRAVRETGADSNESFVDTGAGLTLQQEFLRKFVFNAGVNYSRNDYSNSPISLTDSTDRTDNNYIATAGIDYNIRDWMMIGIGYKYNRKDSNNAANEFVDNQGMLTLKLTY